MIQVTLKEGAWFTRVPEERTARHSWILVLGRVCVCVCVCVCARLCFLRLLCNKYKCNGAPPSLGSSTCLSFNGSSTSQVNRIPPGRALPCAGMPMIPWGDEQGNSEYRNSLWQFHWNRSAWQYQLLAKMNRIRRKSRLETASAKVHYGDARLLFSLRGLENYTDGSV